MLLLNLFFFLLYRSTLLDAARIKFSLPTGHHKKKPLKYGLYNRKLISITMLIRNFTVQPFGWFVHPAPAQKDTPCPQLSNWQTFLLFF